MSKCSNISKVFYKEIDENIADINTAGEFYFNYNMLNVHEMFHADYEESEMKQINLRNQIIGEEIRQGNIEGRIRVDNSILAVSSLKNKVILLADIQL